MRYRGWLGGAFLLALLAGCESRQDEPVTPAPTEPAATPETPGEATASASPDAVQPVAVTVYFPNQGLDFLEAEAPDVMAPPGDQAALLEGAVSALLAGPTEPTAHTTCLPKTVKLNGVKVTGDLATVDLSASFQSDFQGGSGVASMALYSLVNTVTAVEGIKRCRILLDGQPATEFGGVYDLSEPLEADPKLIGGKKF